jgi:small-conductance mechanosensitive channel
MTISVLLVLGGAAVLALVLAAARRGLDLIPMTSERRDLVARAAPVAGAVIVVLYALFASGALLGERPGAGAIAAAVVLLLVVGAAWPALRDVTSGVVVKTGRACRVGDYVRLEGIQGRVQRLGIRTLTIQTNDGDEAVVPYSRLARDTLFRAPATDQAAHHVFRIAVPEGLPLHEAKEAVRIAALHVHWHSAVREPQATVVSDGRLEVTVFPIHPDRGPEIEAAVRARLGTDASVRATAAGPRPNAPPDSPTSEPR